MTLPYWDPELEQEQEDLWLQQERERRIRQEQEKVRQADAMRLFREAEQRLASLPQPPTALPTSPHVIPPTPSYTWSEASPLPRYASITTPALSSGWRRFLSGELEKASAGVSRWLEEDKSLSERVKDIWGQFWPTIEPPLPPSKRGVHDVAAAMPHVSMPLPFVGEGGFIGPGTLANRVFTESDWTLQRVAEALRYLFEPQVRGFKKKEIEQWLARHPEATPDTPMTGWDAPYRFLGLIPPVNLPEKIEAPFASEGAQERGMGGFYVPAWLREQLRPKTPREVLTTDWRGRKGAYSLEQELEDRLGPFLQGPETLEGRMALDIIRANPPAITFAYDPSRREEYYRRVLDEGEPWQKVRPEIVDPTVQLVGEMALPTIIPAPVRNVAMAPVSVPLKAASRGSRWVLGGGLPTKVPIIGESVRSAAVKKGRRTLDAIHAVQVAGDDAAEALVKVTNDVPDALRYVPDDYAEDFAQFSEGFVKRTPQGKVYTHPLTVQEFPSLDEALDDMTSTMTGGKRKSWSKLGADQKARALEQVAILDAEKAAGYKAKELVGTGQSLRWKDERGRIAKAYDSLLSWYRKAILGTNVPILTQNMLGNTLTLGVRGVSNPLKYNMDDATDWAVRHGVPMPQAVKGGSLRSFVAPRNVGPLDKLAGAYGAIEDLARSTLFLHYADEAEEASSPWMHALVERELSKYASPEQMYLIHSRLDSIESDAELRGFLRQVFGLGEEAGPLKPPPEVPPAPKPSPKPPVEIPPSPKPSPKPPSEVPWAPPATRMVPGPGPVPREVRQVVNEAIPRIEEGEDTRKVIEEVKEEVTKNTDESIQELARQDVKLEGELPVEREWHKYPGALREHPVPLWVRQVHEGYRNGRVLRPPELGEFRSPQEVGATLYYLTHLPPEDPMYISPAHARNVVKKVFGETPISYEKIWELAQQGDPRVQEYMNEVVRQVIRKPLEDLGYTTAEIRKMTPQETIDAYMGPASSTYRVQHKPSYTKQDEYQRMKKAFEEREAQKATKPTSEERGTPATRQPPTETMEIAHPMPELAGERTAWSQTIARHIRDLRDSTIDILDRWADDIDRFQARYTHRAYKGPDATNLEEAINNIGKTKGNLNAQIAQGASRKVNYDLIDYMVGTKAEDWLKKVVIFAKYKLAQPEWWIDYLSGNPRMGVEFAKWQRMFTEERPPEKPRTARFEGMAPIDVLGHRFGINPWSSTMLSQYLEQPQQWREEEEEPKEGLTGVLRTIQQGPLGKTLYPPPWITYALKAAGLWDRSLFDFVPWATTARVVTYYLPEEPREVTRWVTGVEPSRMLRESIEGPNEILAYKTRLRLDEMAAEGDISTEEAEIAKQQGREHPTYRQAEADAQQEMDILWTQPLPVKLKHMGPSEAKVRTQKNEYYSLMDELEEMGIEKGTPTWYAARDEVLANRPGARSNLATWQRWPDARERFLRNQVWAAYLYNLDGTESTSEEKKAKRTRVDKKFITDFLEKPESGERSYEGISNAEMLRWIEQLDPLRAQRLRQEGFELRDEDFEPYVAPPPEKEEKVATPKTPMEREPLSPELATEAKAVKAKVEAEAAVVEQKRTVGSFWDLYYAAKDAGLSSKAIIGDDPVMKMLIDKDSRAMATPEMWDYGVRQLQEINRALGLSVEEGVTEKKVSGTAAAEAVSPTAAIATVGGKKVTKEPLIPYSYTPSGKRYIREEVEVNVPDIAWLEAFKREHGWYPWEDPNLVQKGFSPEEAYAEHLRVREESLRPGFPGWEQSWQQRYAGRGWPERPYLPGIPIPELQQAVATARTVPGEVTAPVGTPERTFQQRQAFRLGEEEQKLTPERRQATLAQVGVPTNVSPIQRQQRLFREGEEQLSVRPTQKTMLEQMDIPDDLKMEIRDSVRYHYPLSDAAMGAIIYQARQLRMNPFELLNFIKWQEGGATTNRGGGALPVSARVRTL